MNVKTAKYLRKLIGYNPNKPSDYKKATVADLNGRPYEHETTIVCTGKRNDYKILKKYFKGEDVDLPIHLKSLVEG